MSLAARSERGQARWILSLTRAWILMGILTGCAHPTHPVAWRPADLPPMPPTGAPAAIASANGMIPLNTVIERALAADPDIQALEMQAGRRWADRKGASTLEAPEFRLGGSRSDERAWGWATETTKGSAQSTGTSFDQGVARNFDASVTNYAMPVLQRQHGTSRSETTSRKTSTAEGSAEEESEGFSVGVRLTPPNPWALAADVAKAQAAHSVAAAQLARERHNVACDLVEFAIQHAAYTRMIRAQSAFAGRCSDVHQRAKKAFEAGSIASDDYADAHRQATGAHAEIRRLQSRQAGIERDFRKLAGMEPARADLSEAVAGRICSLALPDEAGDADAFVAALAAVRPDVTAAKWMGEECKHELDEARARRIPWFSQLSAGYAWWESSQFSAGTSSSREQQDSAGTSHSKDDDLDTSNAMTDSSRSWGVERSSQSSTSSSTERSEEADEGEEWRVDIGITVPLFEWLSGEVQARRAAAAGIRQAYDRLQDKAAEDIRLAAAALQRARDTWAETQCHHEKQDRELRQLASAAWSQGLPGEITALRIEQGVAEMILALIEQETDTAMAELNLCRAAGLWPMAHGTKPSQARRAK